MDAVRTSFCRLCAAYCPIEVTVRDGAAIKVVGDKAAPLYGGYTCPKGRALPDIHRTPGRLLHSLKRLPDGRHAPIGSDQAIIEIADRLQDIIARHGPRSVAFYLGNSAILYPATATLAAALLAGIGSRMFFTAGTIDQPGIAIGKALHGAWRGGRIDIDDAELVLLVGGNPLISKQYFAQNPGRALTDQLARGMKLIIMDPRLTETAKRADIHLQLRPGEDSVVLAGLIKLILDADDLDHDFVTRNVQGLEALRAAVAGFDPDYVACRAGVPVEQLIEAARMLGRARKAIAISGTGASMAMHGTLNSYLLLCLQSLRGFWAREGARYVAPRVLLPEVRPKAQPAPPTRPWGFGEQVRIRGLQNSVAGLPTGALCEEILTPGEGQVRALFTTGNPMLAFPDPVTTRRALESLELLVTPNVELSETSRLAHYVIATRMTFETPATTQFVESISHPGYGWDRPFAHFTPALIDPPEGSDLIEDWQLFYRLAKRMGIQLRAINPLPDATAHGVDIDMSREPTSEEILAMISQGSSIPLERVRQHPHGMVFEEAERRVEPRDPDCRERLDVGHEDMMAQLRSLLAAPAPTPDSDQAYPFRLIPRRANRSMNSMYRHIEGLAAKPANPAFMHSKDIAALGLAPHDLVEIRSHHGAVRSVIERDDSLRPGVMSLSHGFGANPGEADDPVAIGANVNALLRMDSEYDPISGMPRMGAVPVSVRAVR